jgi:hypothetical protein
LEGNQILIILDPAQKNSNAKDAILSLYAKSPQPTMASPFAQPQQQFNPAFGQPQQQQMFNANGAFGAQPNQPAFAYGQPQQQQFYPQANNQFGVRLFYYSDDFIH